MIILHSVIIQMRIIHYKEEYDVCKTYKSVFLFECTCLLFVCCYPCVKCEGLRINVRFVCVQTTSSALKGAIQLGIGYTVGNLSSKPERDVLMQDFYVVESIFFPRSVWALKLKLYS